MGFWPSPERSLSDGPYGGKSLCDDCGEATLFAQLIGGSKMAAGKTKWPPAVLPRFRGTENGRPMEDLRIKSVF